MDAFSEWLGKNLSLLQVALVLVMTLDVITRYLFRVTTVAIIDLEWHIFSMIFLLCAGYTLKNDKHVRVDVFYNRLNNKGKAWVNLLGGVLMMLPFCLVCIYVSYKFTAYSFFLREGSPDPGGLPGRYLIKAVIPLGMFLLLLQAFASIFKSVLIIQGQWNKPEKGEKNG